MVLSKQVRLSLLDVFLGVICIFPISTVLIDGGIWNKLLFGILLLMQLGMLFSSPIKRKRVITLFILAAHYCFALWQTSFPMSNTNLLFYYPFFVMYTFFMTDHETLIVDWFKRNQNYVQAIIVIWTILVGVSFFFPGSYYQKEGGSFYFGSFCGNIFRLGPAAVFIQILILLSQTVYGRRNSILYMIVPMYSVMMGSSRTYFGLGLLLFVVSWYIFCRSKKLFWGTVIPLGAVILLFLSGSAMAEKIIYSLEENAYGGFWFRFLSSRNVLWLNSLLAWSEEPILNKLFGCGIEFSTITTGKWAHNDFIELLCSFGIAGLLQYLALMFGLYRSCFRKVHMPKAIKWCVCLVWLLNAFFNMHYVYFCAMLCYPVLLFVVKWYFRENSWEKKWEANQGTQ